MVIDFEKLSTDYDEVYKKCQEINGHIYLKCGDQVELVVMTKDAFLKKQQELMAQQMVLESYAGYLAGESTYSLAESKQLIDDIIKCS